MGTRAEYDVLIRGGGLAGSAAAVLLAREGFAVLVLEKQREPADKVCGEFLSPDGLSVLERLGLAATARAAGGVAVTRAAIHAGGWAGSGSGGRSLEFELPAPGLALSRRRLDGLVRAAAREAGAEVREGARVAAIRELPGLGFAAFGAAGEPLATARLALDGGGKRTPAASERRGPRHVDMLLGVKAHFRGARCPAATVGLHAMRDGYCGLCAVEEDLANVCLLVRPRWLRTAESADAAFSALLAENHVLAERLGGARRVQPRWLITAGLSYRPRPLRPAPVLPLGDAGGLIAPLTGNGMSVALRSAELAVPLAAGVLRGSLAHQEAAEVYAATWNQKFLARGRWGTWIQQLFWRPRGLELLVRGLGDSPNIARFLFARTRGSF